MLPKRQRLSTREVREVLKRGHSARAEFLSVKFIKTDTALRAAAVVQKSVVRNAVQRNRLRRALYQALGGISPAAHLQGVFFVNRTPKPPQKLLPVFIDDTQALMKKMLHPHV
jgi:ribonuclease P protein component